MVSLGVEGRMVSSGVEGSSTVCLHTILSLSNFVFNPSSLSSEGNAQAETALRLQTTMTGEDKSWRERIY